MIFQKVRSSKWVTERKKMISRKVYLLMARQFKALKGHCTTIYREPKPVKERSLAVNNLIDSIHMESLEWSCIHVREHLMTLEF